VEEAEAAFTEVVASAAVLTPVAMVVAATVAARPPAAFMVVARVAPADVAVMARAAERASRAELRAHRMPGSPMAGAVPVICRLDFTLSARARAQVQGQRAQVRPDGLVNDLLNGLRENGLRGNDRPAVAQGDPATRLSQQTTPPLPTASGTLLAAHALPPEQRLVRDLLAGLPARLE
jgi:hypothetical protein